MATNPARPQFQDVIDEAWGDQVADHVIRRFATAGDRDTDLAGIAAADLAGQLVTVGNGPQLHDGTAWRNLGPYVERQTLGRAANLPANGEQGWAPPSSRWGNRSGDEKTFTFLLDCVLLLTYGCTGLTAATDQVQIQSPDVGPQFFPAILNWGGAWQLSCTFVGAFRAGETMVAYFHTNGGANSNMHG